MPPDFRPPHGRRFTLSHRPRPYKETVWYHFDKTNTGFLLDIVRAFGMASRQHNEDLTKILGKILETTPARTAVPK